MKALQNVRDLQRRVTGRMDTTVFVPTRVTRLPAPYSSELSRLSLYRLGLSGLFGKYRVVPRSGIVGHDVLAAKVRDDDGTIPLRDVIATLARDHGAPSRDDLNSFLADADRVRDAAGRRDLLERWLAVCAPRSALGRAFDTVELAICFVMRRARLNARILARRVRS